jgi:choline dehydrogenase
MLTIAVCAAWEKAKCSTMQKGVHPEPVFARLRATGTDPVHDLPGVGENLQDHRQIRVQHRVHDTPTLNTLGGSVVRRTAMAAVWAVARKGSPTRSQPAGMSTSPRPTRTPSQNPAEPHGPPRRRRDRGARHGAARDGPFRPEDTSPGPDTADRDALHDYARRVVSTVFHPVGACRMGQGPGTVVGPDPRLVRLAGLRMLMPRSCR